MISKLGKKKLEKELLKLKKELRRTGEERGEAAREGDLKENSAYIFSGERAEVLRSQIASLSSVLRGIEVQEAPKQTELVCFGHRVKVCFEERKEEREIVLVGEEEARFKPEWISCQSPLGQALLGKRKGERVLVNEQKVLIIEIGISEI